MAAPYTLGEVRQVGQLMLTNAELFPGALEYLAEFRKRYGKIGLAIMEEENLTPQAAAELSDGHVLGPMATEQFDKLGKWLTSWVPEKLDQKCVSKAALS